MHMSPHGNMDEAAHANAEPPDLFRNFFKEKRNMGVEDTNGVGEDDMTVSFPWLLLGDVIYCEGSGGVCLGLSAFMDVINDYHLLNIGLKRADSLRSIVVWMGTLETYLSSNLIKLEKQLQHEYRVILVNKESFWFQQSCEKWVRIASVDYDALLVPMIKKFLTFFVGFILEIFGP
ncbi:hypothetical protein RJT34_19917 [Clitoria ternatea]|uniref:Uncharacterized protein n=1 Tax=Clitoria ternatea TaxID=43366 RepID=A0AAN9IRZ0_CLITE